MIALRETDGDPDGLEMRLLGLLNSHSVEAGHPFKAKEYSVTATEDGVFLGGAQYQFLFGWCFVDLLAVDPKARGKGVGVQLMQRLETSAVEAGCIGIWLDTRGFQSMPFYRKLGYEEFARLPGPVPAEDKIFMRKYLGETQ